MFVIITALHSYDPKEHLVKLSNVYTRSIFENEVDAREAIQTIIEKDFREIKIMYYENLNESERKILAFEPTINLTSQDGAILDTPTIVFIKPSDPSIAKQLWYAIREINENINF